VTVGEPKYGRLHHIGFTTGDREMSSRYFACTTRRDVRSNVKSMQLYYDLQTDSLYIDLLEKPSVVSQEVAPGVVLDFDREGHLVGIDIQNASQSVNLSRLEAESLPLSSVLAGG
jgi:uncharacterized protein YuzE